MVIGIQGKAIDRKGQEVKAQLGRYPSYRESDLPWIGAIPAHWRVVRIKWLLREIDNRSTSGEEELLSMRQHQGLVCHASVSDKTLDPSDLIGFKRTRPRQVVMNRMRASIGMFAIAPVDGLVSPDYAVFEPISFDLPEYLLLLFKTPTMGTKFRIESKGLGDGTAGFLRLYSERFGAIAVALPPVEEQRQILAFIQAIEKRFARLIRNKRRLIALLTEQKQAIIQQAVTRGLDPDALMKPSGLDWLGDITAQWSVPRIKHLAALRSGESITAEQIDEVGDFPVYGGNGLRGYTRAFTHSGDFVLIGRQGALCGNINFAHGKFWASEHAVVAHPLVDYNLQWFGEVLRTMNLNQYSISAAQPGLAVERIRNLRLPVPPLEEQHAIVRAIGRDTASIDRTISSAQREINLVREYRNRLIADVVTGQLDVREAAGALPETEPDDSIDALSEAHIFGADFNPAADGGSLNDDEDVAD